MGWHGPQGECGCCDESIPLINCGACSDFTSTKFVTIEIKGFADDNCTNCGAFNGIYELEYPNEGGSDQCITFFSIPAPCADSATTNLNFGIERQFGNPNEGRLRLTFPISFPPNSSGTYQFQYLQADPIDCAEGKTYTMTLQTQSDPGDACDLSSATVDVYFGVL
jgi:hypothetical protein